MGTLDANYLWQDGQRHQTARLEFNNSSTPLPHLTYNTYLRPGPASPIKRVFIARAASFAIHDVYDRVSHAPVRVVRSGSTADEREVIRDCGA